MRYLVEMKDNSGAADFETARAALAANARIIDAAKRRKRFGGDERWWSVGAGVIIVLLLATYSFGWSVVANVLAALLFAYMAFVMVLIIVKRVSLKRTPLEIDPREAAAALFNKALGLKCDPRVEGMLTGSRLGASLLPLCKKLGGAEMSVSVEINLRMLSSETRGVVKMPCAVTVRGANDFEMTCEYIASFVSDGGDDFTVADLCPEILGYAELSPLTRLGSLMTVGWENGVSDRWRAMEDQACKA